MRRAGQIIGIALLATPLIGGVATAQQSVGQCVARFVDKCAQALLEPGTYVADLAGRPGMRFANTPDGSTLMATSFHDLAQDAMFGEWEHMTIAVNGDARYAICSIYCGEGALVDAEQLDTQFSTALAQAAPSAVKVGGPLPHQPCIGDMSGVYGDTFWPGYIYHVRGWAADPALPMQATLSEGGIEMHAFLTVRAEP